MRTFEIYSLSNFYMYNTILFTIVTTHIPIPGLLATSNHQSVFCIYIFYCAASIKEKGESPKAICPAQQD